MADKIILPGQIQHSNPLFSIVDVNDIRGAIKSVDVFNSVSLQNLHTTGSDKFLKDHTIILEKSSNSFFWMSGITSSEISSWSPISIEQDNRFRYIKASFMIGGRGISPEIHEQLIGTAIQNYFNNNTFIVNDTELIIFIFQITEYGLFLTHERKYTFPNMLGKGVYNIANNNVLQYDEIELMYKTGSGTTTENILTGSVNNIIVDLGDITGENLINYVNTNGDSYDFSDTTKIYYFKFIDNSIMYIYYFEGDNSVNGYGLYGLGQLQFDVNDLTLFYSSDAAVISPILEQDNRFRFVDIIVTLKSKKEIPNIVNTIELLRERINYLFLSQTLRVYETELIIFKFNVIDTRIGGIYTWKYFFKNMQGKGYYSPIYPDITFDQLEVSHQDLIFKPATIIDVQSDINNIIIDFGDVTGTLNSNVFTDIFSPQIINEFLMITDQNIDLLDSNKIYFFKFLESGIEYLYYYSGYIYGIYGDGLLQFIDDDILIFYNSSIYNSDKLSFNNNIPKTYNILSTDIDKPLLDINENDVINYINNIENFPVIVDEYDSMMIFNVYQPQIDIMFGNISLSGVSDINNRYLWNDWFNSDNSNIAITNDNKNFSFSDIKVYGNTVSLIGDLNDLNTVSLNNISLNIFTFSKVSFGKSKIKNISLKNDFTTTFDIKNLYSLNSLNIINNGSSIDVNIQSPYLDILYLEGDIGEFYFPIQALKGNSASYVTKDPLSQDKLEIMLHNLVQSPVSNVGNFGIGNYPIGISGTNSNYIITLQGRGWIFYDPII